MKNERNIDFRATTTSRHTQSIVEMHRHGRYPLFQRGLGGFSSTAQFMQADNFIQTPEDYISYNRYAYCRYNPFKFTDPSGEMLINDFDDFASVMVLDSRYSPTISMNACEDVNAARDEALASFQSFMSWGFRRGIGRPGNSGSGGEGSVVTAFKWVCSKIVGLFTNNSATSATKTSTPNYVEVNNFKGGKQPARNTCAFQNLYDISASNRTNIPYADFVSAYEQWDMNENHTIKSDWQKDGTNPEYLYYAARGLGLYEDSFVYDLNLLRSCINNNCVVFAKWDIEGSIDHAVTIYAYKDTWILGTKYYYWDSESNDSYGFYGSGNILPLLKVNGVTAYGISYKIPRK